MVGFGWMRNLYQLMSRKKFCCASNNGATNWNTRLVK